MEFGRLSHVSPTELADHLSLTALALTHSDLDILCGEAIVALPEEADAVRNGNVRVIHKLLGYVMKASKGRADAMLVQARFQEILLGQKDR